MVSETDPSLGLHGNQWFSSSHSPPRFDNDGSARVVSLDSGEESLFGKRLEDTETSRTQQTSSVVVI